MNRIFWLASYPKSGNTWLRVLLANYTDDDDVPADINALGGGPHAAGRTLFDELIGFEASDLTDGQIEQLRPEMYRRLAQELDEPSFVKVHDAWTLGPTGRPLFPADVTAGVIYIIRSPLDVAVSAANHWNVSVEQAITNVCNPDFALARSQDGLNDQLRQRLLSWAEHVRSWVDDCGLPLHVVRYEDLRQAPEATFKGVLEFTGHPIDPARLARAVAFSDFEQLRQQEAAHGFRERPMGTTRFFRQGQTGSWRGVLTSDQIAQLVRANGAMMQRFGYLDDNYAPADPPLPAAEITTKKG